MSRTKAQEYDDASRAAEIKNFVVRDMERIALHLSIDVDLARALAAGLSALDPAANIPIHVVLAEQAKIMAEVKAAAFDKVTILLVDALDAEQKAVDVANGLVAELRAEVEP